MFVEWTKVQFLFKVFLCVYSMLMLLLISNAKKKHEYVERNVCGKCVDNLKRNSKKKKNHADLLNFNNWKSKSLLTATCCR